MLGRALFSSLITLSLAACRQPAERGKPADEPSAEAEFKTAWSEVPPCYVPAPDAGRSRFDGIEGQYVTRPCPPDAGPPDAATAVRDSQ